MQTSVIDYTVTINYPTTSRLADIVVNNTATTRTRPDGTIYIEQTVTRQELCLVVCALGGCAECDERGGHTCDKVKRG